MFDARMANTPGNPYKIGMGKLVAARGARQVTRN